MFRVVIQSGKKPANYLDERIEAFLVQFRKELEEMADKTFEAHRGAVVARNLEKDKNLRQQTDRYWGEIGVRRYVFHRRFQVADEQKGLTKKDLLEFFDTFLAANSPQRRKLSCLVRIVSASGFVGRF